MPVVIFKEANAQQGKKMTLECFELQVWSGGVCWLHSCLMFCDCDSIVHVRAHCCDPIFYKLTLGDND